MNLEDGISVSTGQGRTGRGWGQAFVLPTELRTEIGLVEEADLSAIESWLKALRARTADDATALLRDAYKMHRPTQAEIVFTSACAFSCRHCIYGEDYHQYNGSMPVERWLCALEDIRLNLNIDTFVYGGRTVTRRGIDLLTKLRRLAPTSSIGIIDTGVGLHHFRADLARIAPDWLDLSFDGLSAHHDEQRNSLGAYQAALNSLRTLIADRVTERVNVLTCVTSINASSIAGMIAALSAEGVRSFFLTPVALVAGGRAPNSLGVSDDQLRELVRTLMKVIDDVDDIYIELGMFEPHHVRALMDRRMSPYYAFKAASDHLYQHFENPKSSLALRYWPCSLTGTREFVVNPDGAILTPKAMAHGIVSPERIVGDVTKTSASEIVANLPFANAFSVYLKELERERTTLGACLENMIEAADKKRDKTACTQTQDH